MKEFSVPDCCVTLEGSLAEGGEREVTGSSIFTENKQSPNCTAWDKGLTCPGKELRLLFLFVAPIMPSVGQRLPKAIQKRAFSGIFKCPGQVQTASRPLPAEVRLCVCYGGVSSNPSFHSRAAVPRAAAGVFVGGWKRWAEGRWESLGEAEGELTFCAPRRRGSDMKH